MDIDMQRMRLKNASTITLLMVLLLLGAVLMSSGIETHGLRAPRPAKTLTVSDIAQQTVFGTSDLDHVLEERGFAFRDSDNLDDWFSDEVMDPSIIRSCLSNSENALFNVELIGNGAAMQSHIKESLQQKGWHVMEEGDVLTCVKSKGYCRWMMIEYQNGEEDLSAVLRILHS